MGSALEYGIRETAPTSPMDADRPKNLGGRVMGAPRSVNNKMIKTLNLAALMILLIGLAYIAYGAFAIYLASQNIADLPTKITYDILATGATWEEWKKTFYRGGAYTIGLGVVSVIAGLGLIRTKSWGRTIWLFLSPILLLTQFAEGQKSLTQFNSRGAYQLGWALLVIIALTWLMLLLSSSRRELAETTEHTDPRDR